MINKRIAVLGVQVPFIRGGAELLNDELVRQINLRGHRHGLQADLIQLPYKWYPDERVLQDMLAWKLIDITQSDGHPIDLVIGTKFPSYCADHPNKVLWLVHQHRAFYDLEGTQYDVPVLTDLNRSARYSARRGDTLAVASCKARYSIAETVSARLRRYNKIDAEVLHPPPKLRDRIRAGDYGDYILYVGRAERIKRVDVLIDALALDRTSRAVVLGTGKYLADLRERAEGLQLGDRCKFPGYVSDEDLLDYLANCRAVYYGPYDEDYGFATVEAFLAGKPVITLPDSGEPAIMVEKTGAGWIAKSASASDLADVTARATISPVAELREIGERGAAFAQSIHWDAVFEKLVESHL